LNRKTIKGLRLRNKVTEVMNMEYIYAALILNSLDKKVSEANVKKVLEAAGAKPDEAKIKALVSALDGVDIKEAIAKSAAVAAPVQVAAAPAAGGEAAEEAQKEEESEEEEEKKAEEAASGLASLFG
jgi:large subunit ribosomal protein L12